MTVAELIEQLKTYPQDAEVLDCDPESLGQYLPVGLSLGYVKDVRRERGAFIQRCEPSDPEARGVVHIG